jgi:hypothetical protein
MRALRLMAVVLAVSSASAAFADELPVGVQVNLLSKLSTYVSGFAPAGSTEVKIWVLYPGKDPSRGAQALASAFTQAGKLGQYTAAPTLVAFVDAKTLEAAVAAEKPRVIYLAPEIDEKVALEIVSAVGKSTALTLSGVEAHVKLGVVLGFSLVEARPRVLINLKQALKQNIVFLSGLVSHSVVVDR